jgi:hypothetical protein
VLRRRLSKHDVEEIAGIRRRRTGDEDRVSDRKIYSLNAAGFTVLQPASACGCVELPCPAPVC